jgi:hypothetical protein
MNLDTTRKSAYATWLTAVFVAFLWGAPANAETLFFTQWIGGPRPPAKPLSVAPLSSGTARVLATAVVATPAGSSWLSVSPNDVIAPATVSVSVNADGLPAGKYTGSISLTAGSGFSGTRQISVALTVIATPNTTLSFSYQVGSAVPGPKGVSLISSVNGEESFVTDVSSTGGNWCSVSPTAGTTPVTLLVSVAPAGLQAGSYRGLVAVTDPNTLDLYTIGVTLTVTGTQTTSRIVLSPDSLNFSRVQPDPNSQLPLLGGAVRVSSDLLPSTTFVTSSSVSWLSTNSSRFTADSALGVNVNTRGLPPGSYNGILTITAENSPTSATLRVSVRIYAARFTLDVTQADFSYQSGVGSVPAGPAGKQINVVSGGSPPAPGTPSVPPGSNFRFTPSISASPGNWIRVSVSNSSTPSTLSIEVVPAGLKPGTHMAAVILTPENGVAEPVAIPVSLTVSGPPSFQAPGSAVLSVSKNVMSFRGADPAPQPLLAGGGLTVARFQGNPPGTYSASTQVNTISTWLSASPAGGALPATLGISASPAGLSEGTYVGFLVISPGDGSSVQNVLVIFVPVPRIGEITFCLCIAGPSGLVVSADRLSFTQEGAAGPAPQSLSASELSLISSSSAAKYKAEARIATPQGGNWLSVSPPVGNLPALMNIGVNTSGLSPGSYVGFIELSDPDSGNSLVTVAVLLTVSSNPNTIIQPAPVAQPASQIISHIADGAKWKTTIILVNLDNVPAPFTLNFWRDNGAAFPISLTGRGVLATVTDTIPAGGSRTIESDGTASALSTGWAEVISSQSIGGTAIFRDQNSNQEAAVPLLFSSADRLRLPFDTGGLSLGVALANPSQTQDITVTRTLRNAQGQVITSDSAPLARHGHTAFVLSNPSNKPEDQRGVLELSSSSGQVFALGIRSNNGAFTSIEALSPQDPKTKVVSHIANGARWKTTIVLVNTDSGPAQFTVNFWKDDGTPLTVTLVDGRSLERVTDTIPVGGSRTIETDGLASTLSTGWAEVVSSQSIGGTAIFRDQTLRQEAAVPLLTSGGTRLLLPFDKGLDLGVALASSNQAQDAGITRTLRNENGQLITSDAVFLSHHAHTAFGLTNPSIRPEDQRGVVEFSSSVEFFSLGIRGNNGAFTSIRALGK